MKIAVVKPDHLGDLVLSAPAIRAILSRCDDATVFVASRNLGLARLLLGDAAPLRGLDLPHLSKSDRRAATTMDFREFDLVVFLRHDGVLNPDHVHMLCRDYIFFRDSNDYHQSILDYTVTSRLIGEYDIDGWFSGADSALIRQKATRPPSAVGLCIAAGFYANSWPAAHWIELGRRLLDSGHRVAIICGPSEANLAGVIARAFGFGSDAVICGGADYRGFLTRVAELDWVVAADGGTAHLCSLVVPILSIFGGSPFRRYAPFGIWNRLLTLELPCSPCCQYAGRRINGCLSTECMTGVTPLQVLDGLGPPYQETVVPYCEDMSGVYRLYFGASHLDREQLASAS